MRKLADGNTYGTPERKVPLLARCFPSLFFYSRFFAIGLRASRQARRGAYDSAAWADDSLAVLGMLESTGVKFIIEGLDVLRGLACPAVFVANHMSTLETMVLPGIIQPFLEVTFVVKKGLVRYPFFHRVMRTRDPVLVGRVNPRDDLREVLQQGSARLAGGSSIVVFPQTTRSTSHDPAHFNSIGVKLARRAGSPLVPLALLTDAWGMGKWIKDLGLIDPAKRVRFSFGTPMIVSGSGREAHRATVRYISKELERWRSCGRERIIPSGC